MAMNREMKRALQRQGEVSADGEAVARAPRDRRRAAPAPKPKEERTSPRQFVKEVRSELRKVAWPTRQETINYSIIVLVALVIMTSFIAGVDWVFSNAILKLFNVQ
jgi:preprotein translocase subunit SecE